MRNLQRFFEGLFPHYRDRIRQGTISVLRLQRLIYRHTAPVHYPPCKTMKLDNASAFIPVEAEDGKFSVCRVKYGGELPVLEHGELSFSEAEDRAYDRNKAEGIPPEIWGAIEDYFKDADV